MLHDEKIKRIAEGLTKCSELLIKGIPSSTADVHGHRWHVMQGDDFLDALHPISKDLLEKHGWSAKYSRRYLHEELTKILHKLADAGNGTAAVSLVKQLCKEFDDYAIIQTVHLPLVGLRIEADAWDVGKVTFVDLGKEAPYKALLDLIHSMSNFGNDAKGPYPGGRDWIDKIGEEMKGRVFAKVAVVAEPKKAEEYAFEETRRTLDLIRYAMLTYHARWRRYVVGLLGEATCETREGILTLGSNGGIGTASSVVKEPCVLSSKRLKHLEEVGFIKMSGWMEADTRTQFQETVLRGVHWLATAQSQPDNQNVLLNLVACLETFLTPKGSNPTAAVSEGAALLIADSYEKRKKVKTSVARLYSLRSNTSHGHGSVVSEDDLDELLSIAVRLIIRILKMEETKEVAFKSDTKAEIENWLEEERLGKDRSPQLLSVVVGEVGALKRP
jgi:hypothetical protein